MNAVVLADFENFPKSYSLIRTVEEEIRRLKLKVKRRLGFHFYAEKIPSPFEPVLVNLDIARRKYGKHYALAFTRHVNNQLVDQLLIETARELLSFEDFDRIVLLASDNLYSVLAELRPLVVFSTRLARRLLRVSEHYYLCERYGRFWVCDREK